MFERYWLDARTSGEAQRALYTATLLHKRKPRNRQLLDSAGFGCAVAQRGLYTGISSRFERRLAA